jgi:hypothetical protein
MGDMKGLGKGEPGSLVDGAPTMSVDESVSTGGASLPVRLLRVAAAGLAICGLGYVAVAASPSLSKSFTNLTGLSVGNQLAATGPSCPLSQPSGCQSSCSSEHACCLTLIDDPSVVAAYAATSGCQDGTGSCCASAAIKSCCESASGAGACCSAATATKSGCTESTCSKTACAAESCPQGHTSEVVGNTAAEADDSSGVGEYVRAAAGSAATGEE